MKSIFAPAGPAAESIAHLGWIVLGLFALVTLAMWGLLVFIVARRQGTLETHAPWNAPSDLSWVWIGGLVVPTVTLGALFVISLVTMSSIPSTAHAAMGGGEGEARPAIRVIGKQWWWEVHYPGSDGEAEIVTANEIHIPVGTPVDVQLVSQDVIHSFWVPRLHGKVDLIPGINNHIMLQAAETGLYPGACAEFCGTQHAHMLLLVSADSPAAFEAWKAGQRAGSALSGSPDAERGAAIFSKHGCASCHTIRGTDADGVRGPDLTHIGSRRAIAANAFPNDAANLSAWVVHAQALKPGSTMPDVAGLTGDELHDLVQYLAALR